MQAFEVSNKQTAKSVLLSPSSASGQAKVEVLTHPDNYRNQGINIRLVDGLILTRVIRSFDAAHFIILHSKRSLHKEY